MDMNIGAMGGAGLTGLNGISAPPSPEDMANRMATSVENGDTTLEELLANLESRFGDEASSIVNYEGELDTEALTELLASALPVGGPMEGGAPPPPPLPPSGGMGGGMTSTEDLISALTNAYGEDAASSVLNEDGSINFDELTSLLKSDSLASTTGTLLDVSA